MQPRLVAWYGDRHLKYKYSGLELLALEWTSELLSLKHKIENFCLQSFNSVLLNLYRNQNDSNGWHSDDEKELGEDPYIASVSLGQQRDFILKHKNQPELKVKIALQSGSLLIMKGSCQKYWKHTLPKRTGPLGPRINLTYRKILTST